MFTAENCSICLHTGALAIENLLCMKKNYLSDCVAGEDEGKYGYFQCEVHLLVDK